MDLRPFYFGALDNNTRIFGGVTASQLSGETPCADWDVRKLMNHMVGGMLMFASAVNKEATDPAAEASDLVGDDPVTAFEGALKMSKESWNQDSALEGNVTITAGEMPAPVALRIALMEAVVHGWDLAKATGQEHGINPMVAAAMLDGMRKTITDAQRGPGKFFEPEVTLPPDAPIEEQLVAFLGRKP